MRWHTVTMSTSNAIARTRMGLPPEEDGPSRLEAEPATVRPVSGPHAKLRRASGSVRQRGRRSALPFGRRPPGAAKKPSRGESVPGEPIGVHGRQGSFEGQIQRRGVHGPAVHEELVVQVRARGETRGTHHSDPHPLFDAGSGADALGDAAQMCIPGSNASGVIDLDHEAVLARPPRPRDRTVTRGAYRGSRSGPIVDALVRSGPAKRGVVPAR